MQKIFYTFLFSLLSVSLFSQKFGCIVDGGFAYRLFAVNDSFSNDYSNYQEQKKSGKIFGFEPVWYSEGNGIGIKYSQFQNEASADSILNPDGEHKSISEKVRFHYLGLQFHKIYPIALSNFLIRGSVGLGAVFYRNALMEYKINTYNIKGHTYALNASINLEYAFSKSLIGFAGAGAYIANINEVLKDEITEIIRPAESLTHIDLMLGLRVNLY